MPWQLTHCSYTCSHCRSRFVWIEVSFSKLTALYCHKFELFKKGCENHPVEVDRGIFAQPGTVCFVTCMAKNGMNYVKLECAAFTFGGGFLFVSTDDLGGICAIFEGDYIKWGVDLWFMLSHYTKLFIRCPSKATWKNQEYLAFLPVHIF